MDSSPEEKYFDDVVLGAVFVVTSILGFCPLYLPFKISTKGGSRA